MNGLEPLKRTSVEKLLAGGDPASQLDGVADQSVLLPPPPVQIACARASTAPITNTEKNMPRDRSFMGDMFLQLDGIHKAFLRTFVRSVGDGIKRRVIQ